MFNHLQSLLIKETNSKKADARYYIENGYMPTWSERERIFNDNGLKRWSTAAKWEAYQAGKLAREKAVEIAVQRAWREIEKAHRADLASLADAEAVPDIETVSIRVDWKKSRTWGYNPTATVIINQMNRYTGSASGCGYDKRTAAIAEALNQSAVIRRMLYQAKEKALADGKPDNNRACIAYGAGYGVLPYFEGGVGMSSFEAVFNACGLKLKDFSQPDRGQDYYYFERG